MRQDYGINLSRIERKILLVLFFGFPLTLEQSAIK
jgi:hypothetical protein